MNDDKVSLSMGSDAHTHINNTSPFLLIYHTNCHMFTYPSSTFEKTSPLQTKLNDPLIFNLNCNENV